MVKKQDVLDYFGSLGATARALRIHENSVRRWPDILVESVVYKLEMATNGYFKTEETLRKEERESGKKSKELDPISKLLGLE